MIARVLAVLLLAAPLAGCLADEPASDESPELQKAALAGPELVVSGVDCAQAGGHSVHPRSAAGVWAFAEAVPEPWQVADVLEDVGPQVTYSEIPDPLHPTPTEGETWGNYHATMTCASWTVNGESRPDLLFGFVGTRVEEPPWGDGIPSRNYLVTVVATNDDEVLAALHAAGIHATLATGSIAPNGPLLETLLDTADHGRYESLFAPKELGAMPDGPIRLWFQQALEGGGYAPVALDLVHTPGGTHYGAEGQGYFGHWGTDMHGPQGGLGGKTAALAYTGFDRTITFGPRPDVVVEDAYHH